MRPRASSLRRACFRVEYLLAFSLQTRELGAVRVNCYFENFLRVEGVTLHANSAEVSLFVFQVHSICIDFLNGNKSVGGIEK